jgi:CO/xanthine dehydrogenase FAD-binding subunit
VLAEVGPEASVLAGGMSLAAMLNMRLVRPRVVIDINRIDDLDRVEYRNGEVRTGALVRQAAALADEHLAEAVPLLRLALPHVGHMQTRNRGTLGGSVAHADPSAEVPLCLVALGGSVELASRGGARRVRAGDFFLGALTTARRADELVTGLVWPRAEAVTGHGFAEIAQRRGDFAIASAAAWARLDEAGAVADLGLAIGGVEDRPRALDCTGFRGAPADDATARSLASSAAKVAEPLEDLHADAAYRRHLAGVLAAQALSRAFARAAGSN